MTWLCRQPGGDTGACLAVAIHDRETGDLIGYVEPDDIAAVLSGDIDSAGLRHIAAQMPEPPPGAVLRSPVRVWWEDAPA